jgi:hypothetical protein
MASLVLDATVGGATANSYNTIAELTAYALGSFESDIWEAADDKALRTLYAVRATRLLDTSAYYPGNPASTTQALQFPRYGVSNPAGGASYDGVSMWGDYSSTVIPPCVKSAHAQLTLWLAAQIAAGVTDNPFTALTGGAGLDSLSVGPISLAFSKIGVAEGMTYFNTVIIPILEAGGCVLSSSRLTR